MEGKRMLLFGGESGWNVNDWTASDDRVRGGNSVSHLTCSGSTATFYGHLDIQTLGGAGFASQRTAGGDREWNLAGYDGIELLIVKADTKQYTFILKDEILPPDPITGRDQSTISYEYDFDIAMQKTEGSGISVFIAWNDLKATYRGREKKDAPSLNLEKVRRMSMMVRSFFGAQQGYFSLAIASISAIAGITCTSANAYSNSSSNDQKCSSSSSLAEGDSGLKSLTDTAQGAQSRGYLSWLIGKCLKL